MPVPGVQDRGQLIQRMIGLRYTFTASPPTVMR